MYHRKFTSGLPYYLVFDPGTSEGGGGTERTGTDVRGEGGGVGGWVRVREGVVGGWVRVRGGGGGWVGVRGKGGWVGQGLRGWWMGG